LQDRSEARLFPRLQAIWGNTHFGPEWNSEWRRALRVCSDAVFPVYFSLAIPTGELSNVEMQAIIKEAGAPERFGSEILRLAKQLRPDGKSKAAPFMVRLQDYTTAGITIDQIGPIISVLFDIGDQLMGPEDASTGIFDLGVDVQIGRVVWQLLKRAEPPKRFEILKERSEIVKCRQLKRFQILD
jgi:predicted KAP-like P-loop ATPase